MRPPRIDTAQLSLVRTPFDHPDFLFELKHDGFRVLAHIWEGKCEPGQVAMSEKHDVEIDRVFKNLEYKNLVAKVQVAA